VITLHHRLKTKPYEANRTLALLSKMFNLAELWGLRRQDTNPCRHVERYEEKARNRFLRDDEITKVGKALAKAETQRTESEEAILAIRLLALTGCRLGEIVKLPRDDADLDAGVFRLRDAKRGDRLVPLGSAVIELLRSTPRRGEFVVPRPDDGTRPFSWSTLEDVWSRIRREAGLEDVRLHDLRHTIGSIAGQHGWNAFTIKAILGHKSLATTDRYVTHDITPMRRAMDDVSGRVSSALAGKKPLKKRARSAKQDFRRD
jgi:integrase